MAEKLKIAFAFQRSDVPLVLSFSFLFAELACSVYFLPSVPGIEVSRLIVVLASRGVMIGAMALAFVVLARGGVEKALAARNVALVCACTAMLMQPATKGITDFLGLERSISIGVDMVARALWGAGFAVCLSLSAGVAARKKSGSAFALLIVSFIFAGIAASVVVSMVDKGGAYAKPLFAVLSVVALAFASGDATPSAGGKAAVEAKRFGPAEWFGNFVDGALTGVAACQVLQMFVNGVIGPVAAGATFVATALIALCLFRISPNLLMRSKSQVALLPFIFLLLMGVNNAPAPFCNIATLGLFSMLFVFNFANVVTLIQRAAPNSVCPESEFAHGRVCIAAGETLGWACSSLLAMQVGDSLLLGTTVTLFALICAQVAMKTLAGDRAGQLLEQAKGSAETLAEAAASAASAAGGQDAGADFDASLKRGCALVAQRNALTQREEEVLFLLARGRSARYIADEFCISEGTVKTHIKRIYGKLDVHSRQELIDIVGEVSAQ